MSAPSHLEISLVYDPFDDVLDGVVADPDETVFVEAGPGFWIFFEVASEVVRLSGFSLRAASSEEFKVDPADVVGQAVWQACRSLIAGRRRGAEQHVITANVVAALEPRWRELYQEFGVNDDRDLASGSHDKAEDGESHDQGAVAFRYPVSVVSATQFADRS